MISREQADSMLGTLQVAHASGASLRQLQRWDESGILPAEMFGYRRCYSHKQVRIARRLVGLTQAGIEVSRAKMKWLNVEWGL